MLERFQQNEDKRKLENLPKIGIFSFGLFLALAITNTFGPNTPLHQFGEVGALYTGLSILTAVVLSKLGG